MDNARTSVPVPSAGTIARPELRRQLDSASMRRLTVVSAGPGWGKSTAVAQWVASRGDLPVAWLTLTDIDDHLNVFWHDLLQAILATGVIPTDHPLSRASTAAGVPAEVMVTLHQGLAALPGPMVLVLDDFHVIEDAGVLEAVQRLVDLDSPLRLILLTRVDPVLALHRVRVEGQLVELTSRDLAFGPDEVQRMGRAASLSLTRQDVDQVLAHTEGWPAGVRLATMYLSRPGSDNPISQFTGTEQSVSEYLLAEVLDRNDPATRAFLLRTAVADRLTAELAEAIVPGARGQALLERLERTNQFVTALGADRAWFRYHPLLRDLLVHTLRRDDPDAFLAAHRAAATWLASREPSDRPGARRSGRRLDPVRRDLHGRRRAGPGRGGPAHPGPAAAPRPVRAAARLGADPAVRRGPGPGKRADRRHGRARRPGPSPAGPRRVDAGSRRGDPARTARRGPHEAPGRRRRHRRIGRGSDQSPRRCGPVPGRGQLPGDRRAQPRRRPAVDRPHA